MPISNVASGWRTIDNFYQTVLAGGFLFYSPIVLAANSVFWLKGTAYAVNAVANWNFSITSNALPVTGSGAVFAAQRSIAFDFMFSANPAGTQVIGGGTVSASPTAGATTLGQVGGINNLADPVVLPLDDFFILDFGCTDDVFVSAQQFQLIQ